MRRDLEHYLSQLQKQYTEMGKAVTEANELIRDGKMTSEQAMQIQEMMNTINNNYQRVLYCRYLLNLPPKFIQKLEQKKLNAKLKKFQEEQADQETVINESQEALDGIEEIVNESSEGCDE